MKRAWEARKNGILTKGYVLGVTRLAKATLIVPRSELPEVVRCLSEFDWFHPVAKKDAPDAQLEELSSRILKVYVRLEGLIRGARIELQPGVIEILTKGFRVREETYTARDWAGLIDRIERESAPIAEELGRLIEEVEETGKRLGEDRSLLGTLRLISPFSTDLKALGAKRHLYTALVTLRTRDLKEVSASLPDAILLDTPISGADSALFVAVSRSEAERVTKVMRSFELRPFSIPEGLPQNPAEAFLTVEKRLREEGESLAEAEAAQHRIVEGQKERLLALHEASKVAYEILERTKRPGALRRFAVLEGYVPAYLVKDFEEDFRGCICIIDEIDHRHHEEGEAPPTIMANRGIAKAFENITLNQGPPKYGEVDPTPILSFIFPIFYGMMFGDLGHGLVLLAFGTILYLRGNVGLKRWGLIFTLSGVAAMVVGVMIGEIFGLPIKETLPLLGRFELIELIERAHGGGGVDTESVLVLLQVAIIVGILHITLGLILNIVKGIREAEHVEVLVSRLPSLILYIFGVVFALAFVGAEYGFSLLLVSQKATPLLGIPTAQAAGISITMVLASIAWIVLGKPIAMLLGKLPKESIGMTVMLEFIETFFEKIPGFLANSMSYARLAILLVVHSSLLFTVNKAWAAGTTFLPIIIFGNIGIILLEGLVVYIQDIRLHLYEWFTKFYDGTGRAFTKINPETTRARLRWE